MKESDWKKIKERQDDLLKDLDPADIVSRLYQVGILTDDDQERILNKGLTRRDKVKQFLEILRTKELQDRDIYVEFLKHLRASPQSFLADKFKPAGKARKRMTKHAETQETTIQNTSYLRNLNVDEVAKFLVPILEKHDIDKKVLTTFKEERITGRVFIDMSMSEMKDVCSYLPFGHRKTIIQERDDYIEQTQPIVVEEGERNVEALAEREYARRFGTYPGYTEKYHKGKILHKLQSYAGNSLEPVHLCIPIDIPDVDTALENIGWETVKFSAACMNDRKNGTVHFGVHNDSEDDHIHGEIAGITTLVQNDCREIVETWVGNCFSPDQQDTAKTCIHPPKYIDVVSNGKCQGFVMEIDIEPKASIVNEDAFFVQDQYIEAGQNKREKRLFRINSGHAAAEDGEGVIRYNTMKTNLTLRRRELEAETKQRRPTEPLMKKLQDVFCSGGSKMNNVYPILVINAMGSVEAGEDLLERFSFLADIDWLCVFDFDPVGDQHGMYDLLTTKQNKSYKVMLTDDFNPRDASHPQPKQDDNEIQEEMDASNLRPWIFCNGYAPMDKDKFELLEWKQKRSEGFKEAVRYFSHQIPRDRAMVVYLLLSKDYTVMLDAADELSQKFQKQWALLAETTTMVAQWKEQLTCRQVVEQSCLESRCITDFKWSDLNRCMKDITDTAEFSSSKEECKLVTNCGSFCTLPKLAQNEMCDLDILSANECKGESEGETDEHRLQAEMDVEKRFYEGHPSTWLNFFCSSHVLRRTIHNALLTRVNKVLEGDVPDNEYIGRVNIYHQPGSGGTTTAMQVLWDLKEKYRCCVLRQYSRESHNQIQNLWKFEESDTRKARPVLVLVDNMAEEHFDKVVQSLHRYAEDNIEETHRVLCVLLICQRQTSPPTTVDRCNFVLKQELDKEEKQWFQTRYNTLLESSKRHKGPNPRHLIAFNIMKENFSEEFIKKTVAKIINGEMSNEEKALLTYVSLLNTYDSQFRGIPVACFDYLMQSGRHHIHGTKWETYLSSPPTMLLARCQSGHNASLRVISPLLSKWILNGILETQGKTLGDSFLEFLYYYQSCPSHTRDLDVASRHLFNILRDMMKIREQLPSGKPSMFSRLIQELYDSKYVDAAAEILQLMFEKTNDPFIAQQLARLYIVCENWAKATHFADEATRIRPNNSCLLDTYGQIFKLRLTQIHTTGLTPEQDPRSVMQNAVNLAFQGVQHFVAVQDASSREPSLEANMAGYFGEVDTYILLLDTFSLLPAFKQKSAFQSFINGFVWIPEELNFLTETQRQWLASLQGNALSTLRKLEDESYRVQQDKTGSRSRNGRFLQKGSMDRLRRDLGKYFGDEDTFDVSTVTTGSPDKARRQVRGLGINSLQSILRLQKDEYSKEKLFAIYKAMQRNSNLPHPLPYDCRIALGSALALLPIQREDMLERPNYDEILHTSLGLFRIKNEQKYIDLEPYLFFVLFHWPTQERAQYREKAEIALLSEAIEQWKDAFRRKFPKDLQNSKRDRGVPFVFITKGHGIESVVQFDQLRKQLKSHKPGMPTRMNQVLGDRSNQDRLQRFDGTLSGNGWEVLIRFETPGGNRLSPVHIQMHIRGERSLWNKKVFFCLGFGWAGPRACDVQSKLPAASGHQHSQQPSHAQHQVGQRHGRSLSMDQKLSWNIGAIDEKLRHFHAIKQRPTRLSPEEMHTLLVQEGQLLAQRELLIQARRTISLEFI